MPAASITEICRFPEDADLVEKALARIDPGYRA
jgi:hypothetical protein